MDAFKKLREWFRGEQKAGNVRCLREIMRDRHGGYCTCSECLTCTCGECGPVYISQCCNAIAVEFQGTYDTSYQCTTCDKLYSRSRP